MQSGIKSTPSPTPALWAGGITALLASACCLGPLLLMLLGVSGAWISSLTVLTPYRPLFLGATLIALLWAARRIWGRKDACEDHRVCATPRAQIGYRVGFLAVLLLSLVGASYPWLASLFY